MGSPFDTMRDAVFNQTKNLFGYDCSWSARDGGATYTGKVLFKNPTEEVRLQGVEYDAEDWCMEYKHGDFPGLYERVEQRNDPPEIVTIDGKNYYVKNVVKVWDGATYRANLKPSDNDLDETEI